MVDLSRFRRRRSESNPRFYDKPSRERHYFSIIGSVLSFVLLVVALALREWAKAGDSRCDYIFGLTKVYINHRTTEPPSQSILSSKSCIVVETRLMHSPYAVNGGLWQSP